MAIDRRRSLMITSEKPTYIDFLSNYGVSNTSVTIPNTYSWIGGGIYCPYTYSNMNLGAVWDEYSNVDKSLVAFNGILSGKYTASTRKYSSVTVNSNASPYFYDFYGFTAEPYLKWHVMHNTYQSYSLTFTVSVDNKVNTIVGGYRARHYSSGDWYTGNTYYSTALITFNTSNNYSKSFIGTNNIAAGSISYVASTRILTVVVGANMYANAYFYGY